MTNPDNVGGLRLSDAEIEFMANEMAGRLGEDSGYIEDMLRNLLGELCRAAPAGGDIEAERKLASRGTPGIDRLWDTQWANIVNHDACYFGYTVEEAVNTAVKLTEQKMAENFKAAALDSAPAGSGEVDDAIGILEMVLDGRISGRISEWPQLKPAIAALLRKLQQGAESAPPCQWPNCPCDQPSKGCGPND